LLSDFSEALCDVFDLRLRAVMHRPSSHLSDTLLFQGLAAADAAALAIRLNELGFLVDPMSLVELLAPGARDSTIVTEPQCDVLFFEKMRDRARVALKTEKAPRAAVAQETRSDRGHAIAFLQDGEAAALTVTGPRYRERPRVARTCEMCGQDFYHGDVDSLLAHRKYHQRYLRSHKPRPLPALADRMQGPGAEVVDHGSPHWLHSEVYERAYWFKREMGYDYIQWELGPADQPPVEEAVGYVVTTEDAPGRIVGACAFRQREDDNGLVWTLDWAWIAPAWRRSGVLARHWPQLVARFGDFPLEYPLSAEMEAFIMKHGTPVQRARATELLSLTRLTPQPTR
jgi:hypothetical protein